MSVREIICGRCGRSLPPNTIWAHHDACKRLPIPTELAKIFEEDQDMTSHQAALDFGVSDRCVVRHLAGTAWGLKRLKARGMAVTAEKNRLHKPQPERPRRCERCYILIDDGDLCFYCEKEIAAKKARIGIVMPWDKRYLSPAVV